jgi:hypothetical protein
MTQDEPTPKLQVDADWKAQAQAEKERLTAEESARAAEAPEGAPGGRPEMPEASFKTLVNVLSAQALMGLGMMQDPETKGVVVDLEGSRFSIDLLSVVEEKTKGNLTDEESELISRQLGDLRARYVEITRWIATQAAAGPTTPGGAPGAPGAAIDPGAGPITP